ncbi:MAG: GTP cyclohydrolase FolE2, partial [Thalassovita sp.]
MNIYTPDMDKPMTRDEAAQALARLRAWAETASAEEIADLDPSVAALLPGQGADYPALSRTYPTDFTVDAAYKADLPDLQNGPSSLIRGAQRPIQHVGISNFRL